MYELIFRTNYASANNILWFTYLLYIGLIGYLTECTLSAALHTGIRIT